MDKRIVKTRTAIFNAVFEISADKDLDKISVVELCEKAGINKSTFYLHYTSIDDCFQKCFGFFTDKILKFSESIDYTDVANAPEETVDKMLDVVEDNMELILKFKNSVLYDNSVRILKQKFLVSLCEANNLNIHDNYHQVSKLTFLIGGCVDAITQNLPEFDKEELRNIMVNAIKRKKY